MVRYLLKLVHFSLYVGQFVILYNFLLHYDFLKLNQNFSQFLVNFHNGAKINRLKIKTPNNYLLPYPTQDQKTVDLTQYLKFVHPGLLWPPPGRLCWTKSALSRISVYWGLLLSKWDPLASFFTFRKLIYEPGKRIPVLGVQRDREKVAIITDFQKFVFFGFYFSC